MGLTIHYSLETPAGWSTKKADKQLEALRQAARDLPVEEVSEMYHFTGKDCGYSQELTKEEKNETGMAVSIRWLKIQATRSIRNPWFPGSIRSQTASRMAAFTVFVAPGCESANFGLCTFPKFVWKPNVAKKKGLLRGSRTWQDRQDNLPGWSFVTKYSTESLKILRDFGRRWNLRRTVESKDRPRIKEFLQRYDIVYSAEICYGPYLSHRRGYGKDRVLVWLADRQEMGSFKLWWQFRGSVEEAKQLLRSPEFKKDLDRLAFGDTYVTPAERGVWGSFCKTQYANDPRCGGLPNFLRAHMSVCAVLQKAKDLGFKVRVSDEGEFWEKRDIPALVKEIGAWDQLIAAGLGVFKDLAKATGNDQAVVETAMDGRGDREQLEAKALDRTDEIGNSLRNLQTVLKASYEPAGTG